MRLLEDAGEELLGLMAFSVKVYVRLRHDPVLQAARYTRVLFSPLLVGFAQPARRLRRHNVWHVRVLNDILKFENGFEMVDIPLSVLILPGPDVDDGALYLHIALLQHVALFVAHRLVMALVADQHFVRLVVVRSLQLFL